MERTASLRAAAGRWLSEYRNGYRIYGIDASARNTRAKSEEIETQITSRTLSDGGIEGHG
jgi:hypothetical protein